MPFLKVLIWVTSFVIIVIFAVNNWVPVTIALWGDLLLDTKLPVLIVGAFLLGWLPTWLWLKGSKWSMKRQIDRLQPSARSPYSVSETPPSPPPPTATPRPSPPKEDTGGLEAT